MDVNDAMVWRHPFEGEEFARMITDHFDTLWAEGAEQGRVVCIALHPYIMGHPHRIRHLERALRHIVEHDGVWRSEEHTSELQSLMRTSYAVFCLNKKTDKE